MAKPDRPTSSCLPEDQRGVGPGETRLEPEVSHDAPVALPAAVVDAVDEGDRTGEALRPVVHVQRLRPSARIPAYQTAGAAGLDLCFAPADGQAVSLPPLGRALLPTGLSVAIPAGFEGQVRPRSGSALRHGLTVLNSPGTIDSDYRGELQILLINLGAEPVAVAPGERIAQLVIAPVARAVLVEVAVLSETARGAGGFGHTGRG